LVWQRDLGPNRFEHGFGSSPALIGDRLIFFHSQDATEETLMPKFSRMLSLEPATGKTVWETALEKTTRVCYGVPVEIMLPSGKLGILAADTGHGIFCLDAESGSLLWDQPVIKQRAVSGALAIDGLALASSGSGGGGNQLVAIRLADQQEVYRFSRNANYVPMPVAVGDKLFVPNDKGILSCCQLATGEILQQQRVDEQRFNISSSLVALGHVLLVLSDEGKLKVISADEDLKTLQEIDLGEPTRATPALHQDAVIFRTETQMQCFGIK
jgi:outer membrane protein assembly factor BamB